MAYHVCGDLIIIINIKFTFCFFNQFYLQL